MATTEKPAGRPRSKPRSRPRPTPAAKARAEDGVRRLDRVYGALDAAQKDLTGIGSSVGTGTRELRRDLNRLLRDARRDVTKMRRAVQRDLERLQKDLISGVGAKPPTRHSRDGAR